MAVTRIGGLASKGWVYRDTLGYKGDPVLAALERAEKAIVAASAKRRWSDQAAVERELMRAVAEIESAVRVGVLTPERVRLLQHALGLDVHSGRTAPRLLRNTYCADVGTDAWRHCEALRIAGYLYRSRAEADRHIYHATDAGRSVAEREKDRLTE